jgi:excisionase family DNA binding protein
MSDHTTYQKLFSEKTTSDLLTRKEAAEYLGVREDTLAIWACKKRHPLKYVKIGRLAKYRKAHLDEFIELQTIKREYD